MDKKKIIIAIGVVVCVAVLVVAAVMLKNKGTSGDKSVNKGSVEYQRNDEEPTAASIEVKTDSGKGYSELIPLQPIN